MRRTAGHCHGLVLLVIAIAAKDPAARAADTDVMTAGALTAADPEDPRFAGHYRGRVVGPDGRPVQGARVYIAPFDQNSWNHDIAQAGPVRAETDADGRFAFDAPDLTEPAADQLPARRDGLLIVTALGYGPAWKFMPGRSWNSVSQSPEERARRNDVTLRLSIDDVPVRGRLLNARGEPLAGARVRVSCLMVPNDYDLSTHLNRESKRSIFSMPGSYESTLYRADLVPGLVAETRTDADGRFALAGLGRERLATLEVTAPDVVDTSLNVMTRLAPDVPTMLGGGLPIPQENAEQHVIHGADFTRRLKPGRTISGVVRDRDSGEPLPGMRVGLGRADFPRDGIWTHETTTDAAGRFTITGLDPGHGDPCITAVSAPGMTYLSAAVVAKGDEPLVIECPRGIPFRLSLLDDTGSPVEAKVDYFEILPNPHAPKYYCHPFHRPLSQAARRADGTYEGFVVPGPGALFISLPDRRDYRPALVDPKAFFAPGRREWNENDRRWAYGTRDTVATCIGLTDQSNYASIVLVNPEPDSEPLNLSATVVTGTPRRVSLIDPDGQPLVGALTDGLTLHADQELPLRSSDFLLTRLHPDRPRRITFLDERRRLIGFLPARAEGGTPVTVPMQPWGGVTGRIIDGNGNEPVQAWFSVHEPTDEFYSDSAFRTLQTRSNPAGRFRIDGLVPGLRYRVTVRTEAGQLSNFAAEDLVVAPGEVRDLGTIYAGAPISVPAN